MNREMVTLGVCFAAGSMGVLAVWAAGTALAHAVRVSRLTRRG